MEEWRIWLYYPLGLLPAVFFGLRLLIQWWLSEKAGRSHVTPFFWRLSIAGNFLMCLHYVVQLQYPFALFQAMTGVLAWRNLDLMCSPSPVRLKAVIALILGVATFVTLVFGWFGLGEGVWQWMRVPVKGHDELVLTTLSWGWGVLGSLGGALFASRFWVQWWMAEKDKKSHLGRSFWWLSLVGSLALLVYFSRIHDYVSLLNQGSGCMIYLRNLFLLRPKNKLLVD